MSEIYMFTSKISNKSYIGKTFIGIQKRWLRHLKESNKCDTYFSRALRKYGEDGFIHTLLEINIDNEMLNEREIYWIKHYNTFLGEGYNMTPGGDGISHMSQEIKDKISETKKKNHTILKGKIISNKMKILWSNENYKNKMINNHKNCNKGIKASQFSPMTVFNKNGVPQLTILYGINDLIKYNEYNDLPCRSLYICYRKGQTLYEKSRPNDISKLKNKGIYKEEFSGWYIEKALY